MHPVALLLLLACAAVDRDEDLALLGSASAEVRAAALERLVAEGAPAAVAAFAGLADEPPTARRARAELVRRAGDAGVIAAAVSRLTDPDPAVVGSLVAFLGRPDLGGIEDEARAAALADVAVRGSTDQLGGAAIAALAGLAGPPAARHLDALLDALAGVEQTRAAEALAGLPSGRDLLVARVRGAAKGEGPLDGPALAALLGAFGPALAEASWPRGEEALAVELAPLLVLARHADPAVQRAAGAARGDLLDRLVLLGSGERLVAVMDGLVAAGWDRREADLRLVWLALTRGEEPAPALVAARRLVATAGGPADEEAQLWRLHGHLLEASVLLADRRPSEAHGPLDRAERIAIGLAEQRADLRPSPGEPSPRFGDLAVERMHLVGLVSLMRAACLLEEGLAPTDLRVLEAARRAHVASLEAQLSRRRSDAAASASNLDALLDRDLAPRRLVLTNGRSVRWSRDEQFDLRRGLLDALASVAPAEFPGIAPAEGLPTYMGEPFADPERRKLLEDIHLAEREVLARREVELADRRDELMRAGIDREDPALRQLGRDMDSLVRQWRELQREIDRWRDPPAGAAPDRAPLEALRSPAAAALTLAQDLRNEGRSRAAIELAEAMLSALEAPAYAHLEWYRAWTGARLGVCIGGAHTDEDRPADAEQALLGAVDRLVELENSIRETRDRVGVGVDPSLLAGIESDLRRTERMRSQALTSLAVNANVKMRDVERALVYFEEAFALDQSDFMKVLRACYRARVGREAEARNGLLEVRIAPALYYNMACTWALLGEDDLAIDFLTRELQENHRTPGSHERQRRWASTDPDLASLLDDPRFQRLVETPLVRPQ